MSIKGDSKTEEHKEKIRQARLKQGSPWLIGKKRIPRSEEHKKNLGNSLKGRISPMKNKKRSKESNRKQSESMKGKPSPRKGAILSKETRRKLSEWNIEHPNKIFKNTSIELKIEAELIKRNINFQKQVPLCKIAIVDFYLPEFRIVIQADGCYWHNCPIHGNGYDKHYQKDLNQNAVLNFNGFNVYRFWEHEINESVEECINRLLINY